MREGYILAEFPLERVELACKKCERHGVLSKAKLLEQYGPNITLPDLLSRIAQCPRHGKYSDWCGAYYVALARRKANKPR